MPCSASLYVASRESTLQHSASYLRCDWRRQCGSAVAAAGKRTRDERVASAAATAAVLWHCAGSLGRWLQVISATEAELTSCRGDRIVYALSSRNSVDGELTAICCIAKNSPVPWFCRIKCTALLRGLHAVVATVHRRPLVITLLPCDGYTNNLLISESLSIRGVLASH